MHLIGSNTLKTKKTAAGCLILKQINTMQKFNVKMFFIFKY